MISIKVATQNTHRLTWNLGWAGCLCALSLAGPIIASDSPVLSDVSKEIGLGFVHFNGRTGVYYFPEMAGVGGGLADIDNDGDLDVYLVQGSILGTKETLTDALDPVPTDLPPRDRLLRNDLTINNDGSRTQRLVDITDESGLRATGYGMGIAFGDIDNDGDVDLYVTNYGPNQLWRNEGPTAAGAVRFSDITKASGTGDPAWSSSAAFFDADADGDLDLYVANYVDFSVENNILCYATSSRQDYCGPAAYHPVADTLYLNRGDGTFEAQTRSALIDYQAGSGLGVATADFDGDGRVDVFVANDGEPNQLWLNQGLDPAGEPRFRNEALLAGVAVNRRGQPEASMGIAVGDHDHDGDVDLFLTHLTAETNTLYVNAGDGLFDDRSIESGLGAPSLPFTGFGTGWLDLDNDGWLDLIVANGAVRIQQDRLQAGDDYPLDQTNQLFRNQDGQTFVDVTSRAGEAFTQAEVGRGVALGDIDNDGDTDALLLNNNGAARLLASHASDETAWLGLRLVGEDGHRDAAGARARLILADERSLWRRSHTDGSYGAAGDPRVLFGLGTIAKPNPIEALEIHWPGGPTERFTVPSLGEYHTLRKGAGQQAAKPAVGQATEQPQ